ncbi:hypothetical protein D3C81_1984530 [compost metagenome]
MPDAVAQLSVVGELDHLVQLQAVLALALPVQHQRAVVVVFRDLRAPAVDQLVVEDDAAEQIGGREVTHFGPAVFPAVVIGLVVRRLVVAGDAADQA